MRQPSEENDRYNNSSGVVWAKLLRVFQNHPIYATTLQQRRNNARQNRYYWQVSNLNIFKVAPCDTDRKIGPLRGHYHFGAKKMKQQKKKKNTT